jgi:Glycosyl hydrolase family 26.
VEDWEADSLTRSDVKAVTGKYPAVMGLELGGIEMGDKASLDSVDFNLIRKAALTHAQRGGIVTISWHPRNPLTGGDAWDVSSDQVVKSLLEGGELHDLFMNVWLVRMGEFLESLGRHPRHFALA